MSLQIKKPVKETLTPIEQIARHKFLKAWRDAAIVKAAEAEVIIDEQETLDCLKSFFATNSRRGETSNKFSVMQGTDIADSDQVVKEALVASVGDASDDQSKPVYWLYKVDLSTIPTNG